ncbi:aldo-keto reductase family 1 member B1-like [Stomoxys calcitrans]|uniref:aldo-keto reductase family 1 member B1-like n=1 Tax=Stomoxys calcitrans TaxID=35570 RepID=UPI0027E271C9|nr:aldo-keto reductase family 1 member B1-like [Stomoxys calcitrans]
MASKLAPWIRLSNGQKMPIVGLGTWRSYKNEAEKAVKDAIDIGYRHIDTAFVYENEHEVGRAINSKIAQGKVKREDMFVVTKLAGIHHGPELVEHACRKSLSKLDVGYIDLYLMHFPVALAYSGDEIVRGTGELTDTDYLDTWKAMEILIDLGLVKGIGLSNFNSQQTDRVLQNCRIRPVVNQVECHPALNQKKLIEFSRQREIAITAYCPLARPIPEQKWPDFLYDEQIREMANRYKRTPAQICLRYLIQLGTIVIPKSARKERIAENFDCFDFELSPADVAIMDQYNNGTRLVPFNGTEHHKYYPFSAEF